MTRPPLNRPGYRRYLLTVLLVILAFNYVDRIAFGLVLQDIKTEFALSDTQLGLLTGIAFALFYSLMGIPIARWADRGDRVTIIALTTTLWSLAVALCAAAGSFAQLLLVRVGVAVGEAGCVPPAHSLIADHFDRAERPRASAIYMLGGSLSFLIGYFVAGWLNQFYGWRVTFLLLGLPGILLGVLAWLTLREPRRFLAATEARDHPNPAGASSSEAPTFTDVCGVLWRNRTFRHILLSTCVVYFFSYGIGQWQASFFIRSHGLQTGALGTWLAIIYGGGGLVGTYCGGAWATRYAPRNERLQLRTMALVYACVGLASALVYLSPTLYPALGLLALSAIVGAMIHGPLFATIQTLVPERSRATSIAIVYLFANLVGMGLGPLAAGALSDGLRPYVGEESLRFALIALSPGYVWGGWHLFQASRSVIRDLAPPPKEETPNALVTS